MNLSKKLLCFIFVLSLSACGGGGGGEKNSSNSSNVDISGVAQLGYVLNGKVDLFSLANPETPIATTYTSLSSEIDHAGSFEFKAVNINRDDYYLLVVSGGEDIDPNDDGVVEEESISVNGKIHAVVKGEELLQPSIRITALSDMMYHKIKSDLSVMTQQQISAALNSNAKEYLFDINGDDTIDNLDVVSFVPTIHRGELIKQYSDILDFYIPKIHSGDNDEKIMKSLMYLDSPRLVVSNGSLQEVPFDLEVSVENKPSGVFVRWFVNSIESSVDKEITQAGSYDIEARLYLDDVLIKTLYKHVVGAEKVEIASIDVDITQDNELFVTDDSGSSLAGTQIIIPKGALSQNVRILVKKSSANSIPDSEGIGASEIISLEPSGLVFDKPVQIRMPYYAGFDPDEKTILVARYSEGGEFDYVAPLFIDKDTKEVVFETEHFTDFELKSFLGNVTDQAKDDIDDLKVITGLAYEADDWSEILNTKIAGKGETTVYDLYLKYKANKEIVSLFNSGKYSQAYNRFYTDDKDVEAVGGVWLDAVDLYEKSEAIGVIYSNLNTLLVTKKYIPQILSNMGLPLNPMYVVKKYTKKVFENAQYILDLALMNGRDLEIDFFLTARKMGFSFEDILEAVEKSRKTEGYVYFNGDEGGAGIFAENGLLRNGVSSTNLDGFIKEYTKLDDLFYSANLIYDLVENYGSIVVNTHQYSDVQKCVSNKYDNGENDDYFDNNYHICSLKLMIEDIKAAIDLNKEEDKYKKTPGHDIVSGWERKLIKSQPGEKIDLPITIETKGYDSFEPLFEVIEVNTGNDDPLSEISVSNKKFIKKDNIYGEYTAIISFTAPVIHTKYNIKSRVKKFGFDDTSSLAIRVQVMPPKQDLEITGVTIIDNMTGGGDYQFRLQAKFDKGDYPVGINCYYESDWQDCEKLIEIKSDDFELSGLANLKYRVIPTDGVKQSFNISEYSSELDIKQRINALLGDDEVVPSVPEITVLSVNGENVGHGAGFDNVVINQGETVTFLFNDINVSRVITKRFDGGVVQQSKLTVSGNEYTYKYDNSGEYAPVFKVLLATKKVITTNGPKITVNAQGNSKPIVTITTPTDITYQAGDKISLNASVSDSDGYIRSVKWFPATAGISIINSTSASGAYFYAPESAFDKKYKILLDVTDNQGAVIHSALRVSVGESDVVNQQLAFMRESHADGCVEYVQKDCGYDISESEELTKKWTFKNTGDSTLENLQFSFRGVDNYKGDIQVGRISVNKNSVLSGEEFEISVNLEIPESLANGQYSARWDILDKNGDYILFPNSNTATMYFKFNIALQEDVDGVVAEGVANDRDALISPNGGERWFDGESRTISWDTRSITGSTVDLYVIWDNPEDLLGVSDSSIGKKINSKEWYKFAGSVANTGSYRFDPSEMHSRGNLYVVLVVSGDNKREFDISDAVFSINYSDSGDSEGIVAEGVSNDWDALISPNGGERWFNGESRTISWDTRYIAGETVDLYVLYDSPTGLLDKYDNDIGATINAKNWHMFAWDISNTGSYTVDPADLSGNGNAYMVLVVSRNKNSEFDLSDGVFSLN